MPTTTDDLPPIVLTVETNASPEMVWAALTDPDRVAQWLTDATPLGEAGASYRLDFGDSSVVDGVVVAVEPGRRFVHTWRWADADPDEETQVAWEVEPLPDGGTRLTLRHEGWSEVRGGAAVRDDHEGYWSGYLDDLVALLAEAD